MTKLCRFGFLVLLLAMFCFPGVARGQDITFCLISLPAAVLQAHTNFSAIYEFDVAQNGIPINIKPVAKEFTKAAEIETCLQTWRLPESPSKHLVATFEWQHEIGWTKLTVSGPDMKLSVHLSGNRCPYCVKNLDNAQPPPVR